MNKIISIAILILCNNAFSSEFVLGRYEAVFETNYGVDILFESGGKCVARQILYPEQEGETKEISERICSWQYEGGIVTVKSQ